MLSVLINGIPASAFVEYELFSRFFVRWSGVIVAQALLVSGGSLQITFCLHEMSALFLTCCCALHMMIGTGSSWGFGDSATAAVAVSELSRYDCVGWIEFPTKANTQQRFLKGFANCDDVLLKQKILFLLVEVTRVSIAMLSTCACTSALAVADACAGITALVGASS
jgi:hypothetical protein